MRGRSRLHPAALGLVACLSACAPTAPSPSLDSLSIFVEDQFMFVGASQTLMARAFFSDGSLATVTGGTWSSDTPSVATVGPTGLVQALAPGRVTFFLDYRGMQARTSLWVTPDYRGTWVGTYVVQTCAGSGSVHDIACGTLFPMGVAQPISLTVVQENTQVSGTIALGDAAGTFEGYVPQNGRMVFAHGGAWAPGMVITLWDSAFLRVDERLEGDFSFEVTMGTTPGSAWIKGPLQSVTRVSAPAPAGG